MDAATRGWTMRGLVKAQDMTDCQGRQARSVRVPRSTKTTAKTTATTV
jgi:hypothetical protein